MFEQAWDWAKAHPLFIAAGVGAIVLVYLFSGSSGGGSSGSVAGPAGPTDAEVNASAQLQAAQIGASVQTQQIGAALEANNNNNATAIAQSTIGAQVANYQTEQAANVQVAGINASQQVQMSGIQSQTLIALANDAAQSNAAALAADVDKARIQAVTDISNGPYQYAAMELQTVANSPALIKFAGVKNSYLQVPGLTLGRNTPQSNTGTAIGSAIGGLGAAIAAII